MVKWNVDTLIGKLMDSKNDLGGEKRNDTVVKFEIEQEETSPDVNSNEEKEGTDEDKIKETPDIHDAQKLLTAKEAILPINVDEDKEKVVEEKAGTKIDDALAALSVDPQTNVDEPLEEESVSEDDNEELDNGNNKGGNDYR